MKAAMAQNASALADVVRPGLLLGLQSTLMSCDEQGLLFVPEGRLKRTVTSGTAEVISIQKAAHLLGRWLPGTGSFTTVMTLLGVRP